MNRKWGIVLLIAAVAGLALCTQNRVWASHLGTPEDPSPKKDRPLYIYKGNYREEINRLKEQFRQAYGYKLMDLDAGWRPEEIKKLHEAFAQLPEHFYRIGGLKGFYRVSQMALPKSGPGADQLPDPSGIPAATFPRFMTVYRQAHQSYQVALTDEPLRIEFYSSLFYKDPADFANIVHHEMGHVYDLSHGFLTFQGEWLRLAGFRILNLPALDGKPDSDYLFTLINDPGVLNYGPVSLQHLPTYSRENPQEDFANSVAAYMHYPFFQHTHPKRYRYLREKVFTGKEYFPAREGSYATVLMESIQKALTERDWAGLIRLVREHRRFLDGSLEKKIVDQLQGALETNLSPEEGLQLAIASCYLVHPKALGLRQELLAARKIQLAKVFKDDRCRIMGRQMFEGDQARWPLMQLRFYREAGRPKVQFLDPAALTAYARGHATRYQWQLSLTSPRRRQVAQGEVEGVEEPNGAFVIDLKETAKGRYKFPAKREVILEVRAVRTHPHAKQPLESEWARLRLVVHPDFEYLGPEEAAVQILYPPSWSAE